MRKLTFLLLLVSLTVTAEARVTRNSMGGDIDVRDAPDGATLRTMGGNIRVDRSNCDVVAKTMGGNIRIRQLAGSLDAGTMGGNADVEIVGNAAGRDIKIRSFGGEVEVTVPRDFAGEFEVELEQSEDGPIHRIISDIPLRTVESTRHHWFRTVHVLTATGKKGSAANRIRLSTIGGNITIRSR